MVWVKNRRTGQVSEITSEQWNTMSTMFPGTFQKVDPPLEKYSDAAKKIIQESRQKKTHQDEEE